MSYILDALKKSDQQRQNNKGPSLQTVHRPVVSSSQSPVLIIVTLTLLLVVVFVGAGFWWYINSSSMSERVIEVASLSKTVEGSVVDSTEQTAEIMNKNINSQAVESNHVVEPVVLKLNESAIRFNDLDAYVRAEVPGLTFSFHVYSDTPVRRTIIINGRRVREGEWVEKQLLLEEITPKGVILIWNGLHRFSIDVVDGW